MRVQHWGIELPPVGEVLGAVQQDELRPGQFHRFEVALQVPGFSVINFPHAQLLIDEQQVHDVGY